MALQGSVLDGMADFLVKQAGIPKASVSHISRVPGMVMSNEGMLASNHLP
jgi:hypothetical protein